MADSTLLRAEEYIDVYYAKLKKELNARGLQISKVGVIGLLLHILGFSQQDIKLYYDTLFREAFLSTADKYENLVMHGSIFGYTPGLAIPAKLTGNISFNTAMLPISNDPSQTMVLENAKTICDGMTYTLRSKYIFKGSDCQILDEDGNITTIPVSVDNPSVPVKNCYQYDSEETLYNIPFYTYNSYYQQKISIPDTFQVCGLTIEICESGEKDETTQEYIFVPYEWKLVNYSSTPNDRHVFVQFLPDNELLIELGSGVHGKYIPNSVLKVNIQYTKGSLGNISKQNIQMSAGELTIFIKGTSQYTIPATQGITVEVDHAEGGSDSLDGIQLRSSIIEFIRHRNNLMSEHDFYDILKRYFDDFELMFKKCHIMDNNIYSFIPIRDEYQVPVRTQSISVKHPEFNPKLDCFVYNPIFDVKQLDGSTEKYISPFLYVVDFRLRQYKGYILKELTSTYFSDITIEKEQVPTLDPYGNILDSGEIKQLPLTFYCKYDPVLNLTRLLVQSYEPIKDYIFFITIPSLNIIDQCMTSVYENVVDIHYANSTTGIGVIFEPFDVELKIYKVTSSGLTSSPPPASELIFTYKLYNFQQTLDISDILSLKTWDGEVTDYFNTTVTSPTATANQVRLCQYFNKDAYVLNIPVMKLNTYDSNPEYYQQKIINALGSIAFSENRMISDDVQVRFINSDILYPELLSVITKQHYTSFGIKFPFHLSMIIHGNNSYILEYNIVTSTEIENLREELANKLFNTYTGTSLSFYKTQFIDIIHNMPWVKWCEVIITDDLGTEIPDGNFEVFNQKELIDQLDKRSAVVYCPLYYYWNLDDIKIELKFE